MLRSIGGNMNIADMKMKATIDTILLVGYRDENPRPKYADGKPAHTISVNQIMHQYDLSAGEYPLGTLRPQAIKSAIAEILWIYQKQSNDLKVLADLGVTWWDEWESKMYPGTIGIRYGETVRKYDLMNKLLKGLIEDPFGRRHIMSLWQETDFEESDGLKPCAFMTMWNVRNTNGTYYLDMTLVQRSSDWITAGLINQFQYCCLMMMVAKHCGYEVGVFTHFIQNVQIYDRHLDAAETISCRNPIDCQPYVELMCKDFYSATVDDFVLRDYPVDEIKKQNPNMKLELGI